MKAKQIIRKPIAGDYFVSKNDIDVIDVNGMVLNIKKNAIVILSDIQEATPSMRLDRKTKFIPNWICRFFYNKRLFTLRVQNTSQESLLFEHFDHLTSQEEADALAEESSQD